MPLSRTSRCKSGLLIQDDGDFAGLGVFAHVVEQLLQQAVEGEAHRFAGGRVAQPVIETAVDARSAKANSLSRW